jgi:hypothetical protein
MCGEGGDEIERGDRGKDEKRGLMMWWYLRLVLLLQDT